MLRKTVINTLNEYNMLKSGDRIIVALSGGADSVCLLHILNSLKENFNITLEAVHINHCIRGKESDGDEDFCTRLCNNLNIPIKVYRIDIPKLTKLSGKSTEETARDIRYEKFAECAGENGKIATAHTLSDNAETVIFNMIRGTGLKGLCGIPPVRGNIIRPLINITREQVEDFLNHINQDFKTDSTNLSDDYTRNKIRHKIIPIMQEINSGFYKCFSNEQKVLKEENSYLERISEDAYISHFQNNSLINISQTSHTIRKRVISKFLSDNNLPISFDKINEISILSETGGKINICKDTFLVCKKDCLFIEKKSDSLFLEKPLEIGENQIFENKKLIASKEKTGNVLIDMDKVCGKIILHSRRYGDKIKLCGRDFTCSVKKLLNENVPAQNRPFIHFLSDDNGLIFMEGFGAAQRVAPDEFSENILSIEILKL